MGVPAFFRWLSRKYSSIVVHCQEEKVSSIPLNIYSCIGPLGDLEANEKKNFFLGGGVSFFFVVKHLAYTYTSTCFGNRDLALHSECLN